jgi:hypothetical protein
MTSFVLKKRGRVASSGVQLLKSNFQLYLHNLLVIVTSLFENFLLLNNIDRDYGLQ